MTFDQPNDQQSQAELSLWQILALLGGGGAIALPVIGEMVFGLLGITPEDPAWGLALLSAGFLAAIAGRLPLEWHRSTGCWPLSLGWLARLGKLFEVKGSQIAIEVMTWTSRGAAGSLLGFFYGGRWTEEDVRGAIAGLVVGLLLAMLLGWAWARRNPRAERLAGGAIALCAAYGLWFWLGAWGLAALMAGQWLPGLFYGLTALFFGNWAWVGGGCLGRRDR